MADPSQGCLLKLILFSDIADGLPQARAQKRAFKVTSSPNLLTGWLDKGHRARAPESLEAQSGRTYCNHRRYPIIKTPQAAMQSAVRTGTLAAGQSAA